MYESYWGMSRSPFHTEPSRSFFYPSPTHDEAAARLEYLIGNHRRLGIVSGDNGTGKTSLFHWFSDRLRRSQHLSAVINTLGVGLREFLWQIASVLHTRPEDGDDHFQLWRRITNGLSARRYAAEPVVLLLDDAADAQREVIECLTRLVHIEPTPDLSLTVILAVEPERKLRLGNRVLENSDLHIELEPRDAADIVGYLDFVLKQAGCDRRMFPTSSIERLYVHSHGNPRRVAQLAELALVATAAAAAGEVTPSLIDDVQDELLRQRSPAAV